MSLSLTTVGQIGVGISDQDRATAFYRDILGMQFLFQVPGMSFFNCNGVRLMLALPEGGGSNHESSVIYYKVDDIHASTDALRSQDVTITGEPHEIAKLEDHALWMSFFEDSEGNTVSLMSEVAFVG